VSNLDLSTFIVTAAEGMLLPRLPLYQTVFGVLL